MTGQIRSRVPWDEYLSLPGLSISRLKELRRSPQHYLYRMKVPRESAAMRLGTAAHCAVLEPERFDEQFAVWDRRTDGGKLSPRRGRVWEAFEREHAGRTIITDAEAELVEAIRHAVHTHPATGRYLWTGDPEVTMQWELGNRTCKGRVDWLTTDAHRPVLVGLKTARDCRPFIFGAQAARLGYHLQWAFYHDGYAAIQGVEPRLVEIVVESDPPHAVAVYSIPRDIIDQGRDEYRNLLAQLDECTAAQRFPGPCDVEQELSLPTWVYRTDDDIADLELET